MTGKLLARFFGRPARLERVLDQKLPADLLTVGRLVSVTYDPPEDTDRGRQRLTHRFDDPPELHVGADGRGIYVPGARFTARGFVG